MKLGIMQPYFFPYLGYFQLIGATDRFVVYDDVNFIKGGWVNRNNILSNGSRQLITLQLKGASSFKHINQVMVGGNKAKLAKTIKQAYSKAPYFENVFPMVEECLNHGDNNLAKYLSYGLSSVSRFLGIDTEFIMSSDVDKDNELKGQDKVLAICEKLGADEYYNAIGGTELYSQSEFKNHGVELKFVRQHDVRYEQFDDEFVGNLSIIDVLMFNPKERVVAMLEEYDLVD